jgi:hypothetical protein
MPRKLVVAAWREMFPDGKPRVVQPDIRVKHSFVEIELDRWKFLKEERWIEPVDVALERVVRPLAEKFLVSPIAMRIRLEKLRLLHRKVPHQHLFASA